MTNNINKNIIIQIVMRNYFDKDSNAIDNILVKYQILLLLKKFQCLSVPETLDLLKLYSKRSLIYNMKKAEEKLLISKSFREEYFKLEEFTEENLQRLK